MLVSDNSLFSNSVDLLLDFIRDLICDHDTQKTGASNKVKQQFLGSGHEVCRISYQVNEVSEACNKTAGTEVFMGFLPYTRHHQPPTQEFTQDKCE